MGNKKINEITITSTKSKYPCSNIDDDLLLFDKVEDLPFPNEPRRMRCILLALCLKGKAQYSVNAKKHEVRENDMIIINEGQVTDDYLISRDCKGIGLMISSEFFREIIKDVHELSSLFLFSRNHPVFTLKKEEVENILEYYHILKQKLEDISHHFRKETVRLLLTTVIYDLSNVIYNMQNYNDKKQTRAEHIFTEFIYLLEQNFKKERRVSWYAQKLCISPKYLSETIKQISHHTPNEWIDNYVSLEIRVLLKNSSKSIKEITQELNFPNQSFLGKYFKEHVGISPSQYRKT
jgi:AraC-like DNA-binding protein